MCWFLASVFVVCWCLASVFVVCWCLARVFVVCWCLANVFVVCLCLASVFVVCWCLASVFVVCWCFLKATSLKQHQNKTKKRWRYAPFPPRPLLGTHCCQAAAVTWTTASSSNSSLTPWTANCIQTPKHGAVSHPSHVRLSTRSPFVTLLSRRAQSGRWSSYWERVMVHRITFICSDFLFHLCFIYSFYSWYTIM